MSQNRTMQQKNALNRKRKSKEIQEQNRLMMSTHVYIEQESKLPEYIKREMYANGYGMKYVIYLDLETKLFNVIEKACLQALQALKQIKVIKYARTLQDVKAWENEYFAYQGEKLCLK